MSAEAPRRRRPDCGAANRNLMYGHALLFSFRPTKEVSCFAVAGARRSRCCLERVCVGTYSPTAARSFGLRPLRADSQPRNENRAPLLGVRYPIDKGPLRQEARLKAAERQPVIGRRTPCLGHACFFRASRLSLAVWLCRSPLLRRPRRSRLTGSPMLTESRRIG